MRFSYKELQDIKKAARIAMAFASTLEADDPKEQARLLGWHPGRLREHGQTLFRLSDTIKVTDDLDI